MAERGKGCVFERGHVTGVANQAAGAVGGAQMCGDPGAAGGHNPQIFDTEPVPHPHARAGQAGRNGVGVPAECHQTLGGDGAFDLEFGRESPQRYRSQPLRRGHCADRRPPALDEPVPFVQADAQRIEA